MTEVSVGIVPDQQIVVMSIDGESIALPTTGAVKVGALLMKAGLQAAATVISPDALDAVALLMGQLDKMLAKLDA